MQSWLGCLCRWSGRQPLPAGGREHGDGSTRSCCCVWMTQVPSSVTAKGKSAKLLWPGLDPLSPHERKRKPPCRLGEIWPELDRVVLPTSSCMMLRRYVADQAVVNSGSEQSCSHLCNCILGMSIFSGGSTAIRLSDAESSSEWYWCMINDWGSRALRVAPRGTTLDCQAHEVAGTHLCTRSLAVQLSKLCNHDQPLHRLLPHTWVSAACRQTQLYRPRIC